MTPESEYETLRRRLHDAKLRVDFARIYTKEIRQDAYPGADGHFAFAMAVRAETEALGRYARILREMEDYEARRRAKQAQA